MYILYRYDHYVDKNIINISKTHMSSSSVVVCGLLKNCEKNIDSVKSNIYRLVTKFKKYKILIVENDSEDNTRKLLLNWSKNDPNVVILGCGENSKKCVIDWIKDNNLKDHSIKRIEKMVYLRNLYMDYINRKLKNYDYTIIYDFDIDGIIYENGLYNAMYNIYTDDKINVICPNGFYKNKYKNYYDPYAFVDIDADTKDRYLNDRVKYKYIDEIFNDNKIKKVKSAFAGISIYKTSFIYNKLYKLMDIEKESICEHVGLNLQIPGVYIDPKFEYLIKTNYT